MGSAGDHGWRPPTGVDRSRDADPLDEVFDVLSDPVRRRVLYRLHFAGEDVARIESLVDAVVDAGVADDRAAVRTALEEVHLPRLGRVGLVAFDAELGKVTYCPWPALSEWLEHAAYTELPRSHPLIVEDREPVR